MAERLIGIDVGGTKVSVAALRGAEFEPLGTAPTETRSADALLAQIADAVAAAGPAAAVGVALPSIMDWARGVARYSVNVPLIDVPVRDRLRERLALPVYVDNDATAAALAEAYSAGGQLAHRDLVAFTIGTGVGGGVILGGRPHRGATGAAGELGHMIIGLDVDDDVPAAAGFPQRGSLESLAAGRTLDGLAQQAGLTGGQALVERARAGDPSALALLTRFGRRLGLGIANVINALEPEVVAIAGGVSAAGALLLGPATEVARQYTITGSGSRTEIRLARHGASAGVRGAALLAGLELANERGVDAAEVLTS